MRQGGNVVWALDVTDPPDDTHPNGRNAALPYPGYLWEFPCEADSNRCNGTGGYDYRDYMGETWSDPIVTRIRVKNGADDNGGVGYDRWVAIFGAGYHQEADPNHLGYDATLDKDTSRKGRAVFVIDMQTGEPIAMKRFDHSPMDGDPRMLFGFAAAPAVFDLDFDGYADIVYFGDLGGNLYKWVIEDFADLPSNDADLDQSGWVWVRLFEADHCSFAAEGASCPTDHYKSLFFPPTGALVNGVLWLAFGSGERSALDFPGYPGTTRENNRFYVLKDMDPLERHGAAVVASARFDDFPGSTDLALAGPPEQCNHPAEPAVGYYLDAVDSEKFVTNSVIFFGNVFTLSFMPDLAGDACSSGGNSFLYGFDLFCAEGVFTEDDGAGGMRPVRHFDVGPGVPNRPRVSVGPIETPPCDGDECDPCQGPDCEPKCENKVVVITSDGETYSDSPTDECPSGIRLNSWRDF
jgi:hypothetical protein